MTSPDGITWTSRTSAANNTWYSVTYGNGIFVAVSVSGTYRVMTSPDGITWTSRTSAANNTWQSVTYGNGLFVAVSFDGTVMTSPDGITWTSRTSAVNQWMSVTYGNGLFVAVSQNGTSNRVMTSAELFAPSSPSINSITPSGTSASVAFTVPSSAGSAAITNYEYSLNNGSTWVTPSPAVTASPFTISGLTGGTTYPIQLRAVNSVGSGCASATVSTTTLIPPNAPTGVVATAGVNGANIAFTAPSNDGGGAITSYEYSINNGSSWTAIASTSSPLNIGSLTNCTEYTIKIRAVNGAGGGTASAAVTVTPQNGQQEGGTTWSIQTSAADNQWQSVTYGNGLFVAVSRDGAANRVMTSPDGITWTPRTPAVDNPWQSVTYGNGLFVAVAFSGSGNRVMTSPDGITWTPRNAAANNNWYSVTYGNGLFVAVAFSGIGNRVMTSPDGITWTSRTSAANIDWQSVTYGNGLFVAVAETGTGNRVMTSPDGITWTIRTSAANDGWISITYGNGVFVAVSYDGTVMTSPDGIIWTNRTSATNSSWYGITFGNGLFVAVAYLGAVMTSSDGINWTSRTSATNNNWRSVTYANGLFVAVSTTGTGNRVMTSSDVFAPGSPSINSITPAYTTASVAFTAPTNSGYSAITNYEYSKDNGSTWVTPSPAVTTSPFTISGLTGGTTYPIQLRAVNSVGSGCGSATMSTTTLVPVSPNEPTSVVATAGLNGANIAFTAPSNDGGGAITSYEYSINNGSSWTAIASTSSPLNIGSLTNCTEYTIKIRAVNVAGGGTASAAVTVTPQNGQQRGITWTSRTSAAANNWNSVTYGNGLFVAVASSGTDNRVMTSLDGINWIIRTSAANNIWQSVTYGNGVFVAVASYSAISGNRVMTSPDGITWTIRTSAANNSWSSVTYGNGLFVAVASYSAISGNRVMTSPDGITWTSRTSAANNSWTSVTYGNGLFVAVSYDGAGNRVMTSPDGITWTIRTSAVNNFWQSVTYGNGLFVAVSQTGTGNCVMTSPDRSEERRVGKEC
jgi:predicted RecA/RadA family phage recombinase